MKISNLKIRNLILLLLISSVVLTACLVETLPSPVEPTAVTLTPASEPRPKPAPTDKPVYFSDCGFLIDTRKQADAVLPTAEADLSRLEGLTHYDLSLAINFEEGTYQGSAVIDYRNDEGLPLDEVYFRLLPNGGRSYGDGELLVHEARLNGEAVQTSLSLDDSVLRIGFPALLEHGQCARFEFEFTGMAARDFTGGGYGIHTRTGSTLTLSGWYPHIAVHDQNGWSLHPVSAIGDSVFSDMALYSVEVTVDQEVIIAATGVEANRSLEAGYYRYHFISGPMRDFFLSMSPDYEVLSQEVAGTLVNSYFLRGKQEKGLEALEYGVNSLEAFHTIFGRYPYKELDLVEAPLVYAGGVEFPGIVLLTSRMYEPGLSGSFEILVAHEVAHQWWYNLVGNDVFEHPWLDEALTTYSSALYFETVHGRTAYDRMIEGFQSTYENIVSTGQDEPVASPLYYFEDGVREGRYGPVVYRKGALFFHHLRHKIGDEAFINSLRDYYDQFRYEIAYPEDLLGIFQENSEPDLVNFFEDWLYSSGIEPSPVPTVSPTFPPPTPSPTPAPEPVVRFAVIGDFGKVGEPAKRVSELVKSWDPDFIVTTGDNNYPDGAYETIDDNIGQYYHEFIYPYQGTYGEGADINRFFPSLGNHDYYTDNARPYLEYFNLPGNGRYYDFTWGPVHLFAINANYQEPDGVGRSSVQAAWLRETLEASSHPWKIVYMHHPPYSSGHHGSIDWMRWPYKEWGATAVLSGHDHTYERLIIDGFPYFVNGLGGGARYSFREILPGSQVRFSDNHGAMLATASSDQITFQFFTAEGELIDDFSIVNRNGVYESVEPEQVKTSLWIYNITSVVK
jgi:tartrate-resistant acid phosphatase type 5